MNTWLWTRYNSSSAQLLPDIYTDDGLVRTNYGGVEPFFYCKVDLFTISFCYFLWIRAKFRCHFAIYWFDSSTKHNFESRKNVFCNRFRKKKSRKCLTFWVFKRFFFLLSNVLIMIYFHLVVWNLTSES